MAMTQQQAIALASARLRLQQQQQPPASFSDTAVDAAKGFGSGIMSGAADLVGLPGTISNVADSGLAWLQNKAVGLVTGKDGTYQPRQNFLSGQNLNSHLSDVTNGANEYQPKTVVGQYSRTAGEFLPSAAVGGLNPANLIRNGVAPALGSETAGQLTKDTWMEPYARFVGGIVGGMAPSLAERAITPFPTDAARTAAANTMRQEGVDLTAGQRTGNSALKYAESELGGSTAQNVMERQGEQFTSAALRRAGINANRATPDVLDAGLNNIGQQFDTLAANNTLMPDTAMVSDIRNSVLDYRNLVSASQRAPVVDNIVQDIAQNVQGGMNGSAYQGLRSRLDRLQRTSSDPHLSRALSGIRNALDDAMERSISNANPTDVGAWREARRQYRNFLIIEKAATGAGENAALGLILPSQLRNAVVQQGRRYYARGQGDFADLARSGEATMKALPNSGTSGREGAKRLGMSIPAVMGGGIGAATGGSLGAMAGMAVGAAAPRAIGEAILSRPGRAYLSNQLLQPTNLTDPRRALALSQMISQLANGDRSKDRLPAR